MTLASTFAPPAPRPAESDRAMLVQARGLTKSFTARRSWRETVLPPWRRGRRTTAVRDVTFEVGPAEFFGLLGANGAGKTTLFKMLATHLVPDAGTALVAGYDVVRQARDVRGVLTPVAADERSLHWRLTARENLELFAALYGLRGRAARARIDELLQAVELHDTGNKMAGAFSSGMKQRLLLARALLARPRVLLLDEPTRSLDPVSARRFRRFLREEIVRGQQCAVLLATHNAEEAFDLCDRVGILDRGRLLAVGRAGDLVGEITDDRYRLSVREGQVDAAIRLAAAVATDVRLLPESDTAGWSALALCVPRGSDGASDVLARLVRAGIGVSSLERISLTLADLLEHIVERQAGGADE